MTLPEETTTETPPPELPEKLFEEDAARLETAETLEAAADYIDTHGWTRGRMNVYNRVCSLGAIDKVTKPRNSRRSITSIRAIRAFAQFIKPGGRGDSQDIVHYNDRVAKNGKEVSRKMREAAAWLLGKK